MDLSRKTVIVSLVWLALALASFVVQGRFLAHYAIPLVIPLGVLGGLGVDVLSDRVRAGRSALIAPILLTVAISSVAAVVAGAMEFEPIQRDRARARAVAEVIDPASEVDARIWAWGNEPCSTPMRTASGHALATSTRWSRPATPRRRSWTRRSRKLEAAQPQFIVDVGSPLPGAPGFQPLLIAREVASDGRDLDRWTRSGTSSARTTTS